MLLLQSDVLAAQIKGTVAVCVRKEAVQGKCIRGPRHKIPVMQQENH